MWQVWRSLGDWLDALKSTGGYRGLVLLHTTDLAGTAERLAGLLHGQLGPGLCVAPAEHRSRLAQAARGACRRLMSPGAVEEILGAEAGFALLLVPRLLRPNLLAAAGEAVRGGGVLALVAPPLPAWQPGGEESIGAYRVYLVERLYSARSLFWASLDEDTVYAERLPACCAGRPEPPAGYRPREPLPRLLVEAAATREQAEALDEIVGFLRRRGRSVLVLGDRGRGKSGLLALTVAYLVHAHMAGFVSVTAPTAWSVQSFFHVLDSALTRLGDRHWLIRRHGLVVGAAGPWFHVRYHTPDQAAPGAYTVVDEAAAVGPSRLRAIASRSPRLLAASTVHGYEGSGRLLAHAAGELLPEPRLSVELRTPVRYPPGDPLEEWLYSTFMLRVDEPPAPAEPDPAHAVLVELDRRELARNQGLLAAVYSLLAAAHYRNEPDDLALMLDAPHHRLYALKQDGHVVAAADVAEEGPGTRWEHRILYDRLAEAAGSYRPLTGWRIVRIAVHPRLQRKGLGSRMLQLLLAEARRSGASWLGAIYGRPRVTRFWLRNGLLPVYVSPLPSRATGEHNVGAAVGLDSEGARLVAAAAADAASRLLWGLGSLYRSLDPEAAGLLLAGDPALAGLLPGASLSRTQVARLRRAAAGQALPESALDAIAAGLQALAARYGGLWLLGEKERLVAATRVLQGRTPREIGHLAATGEIRRSLQGIAAELLLHL